MWKMDPMVFMDLMENGDFAMVIGEDKAEELSAFLRNQLLDHEAWAPVYIKVPSDEGDWGLWLVFHLKLVGDNVMSVHIHYVSFDGKTLDFPPPPGFEDRPSFSAEMIRYESDPFEATDDSGN